MHEWFVLGPFLYQDQNTLVSVSKNTVPMRPLCKLQLQIYLKKKNVQKYVCLFHVWTSCGLTQQCMMGMMSGRRRAVERECSLSSWTAGGGVLPDPWCSRPLDTAGQLLETAWRASASVCVSTTITTIKINTESREVCADGTHTLKGFNVMMTVTAQAWGWRVWDSGRCRRREDFTEAEYLDPRTKVDFFLLTFSFSHYCS